MSKQFDPESIVKRAINSDYNSSVFSTIDDSEIDKAANWLEWCLGKNFLNMSEVLPKQAQIATVLFGEWCPRCSKPGFIHHLRDQSIADIRENVTILDYGICPRCEVTQGELFSTGELGEFNELNCVIGRRGGKSSLVSMLATYQLHRVLALPNPSKYYGVLENDTLHIVFLAVTAKQARDTLWDKFTARIDSSSWFKAYHKLLHDQAKRNGLAEDDIYNYSKTELQYGFKALKASYYPPNLNTMRGYTTIFCATDELSYFDSDENSQRINANAAETYNTLDISSQTIRTHARRLRSNGANWVPTGLNVSISSPFAADDMTMRLLKSSTQPDIPGSGRPNAAGYHVATWDANAAYTRESLWAETPDKEQFYRNYACEPSLGGDQVFLKEEALVKRCFSHETKVPLFSCVQRKVNDPIDPALMSVHVQVLPTQPDPTTPRVIGVDMGYNNNSFGMCIASYDSLAETVVVDGVLECEPLKFGHGSVAPIDTVRMFEMALVPLLKSFNIVCVVYDRWQSLDAVGRIRSIYKKEAEQYSLKWSDFQALKTVVHEGKLRLPKPEVGLERLQKLQFEDVIKPETPIANLQYQMLTVREIGTKVTKPYKGNDDLFRSMSLCVRYIKDPANTPKFLGLAGSNSRGNARTLGNVHLYNSPLQDRAGGGVRAMPPVDPNKKSVVKPVGAVGHSKWGGSTPRGGSR